MYLRAGYVGAQALSFLIYYYVTMKVCTAVLRRPERRVQ